MDDQHKATLEGCPDRLAEAKRQARECFESLLEDCGSTKETQFFQFERSLMARVMRLGCLLIQVFLAWRHQQLDLRPFLEDGTYEVNNGYAERTLQTAFGEVRYGRQYLVPKRGGAGFHPLDVVLGLTRDKFSPWVVSFVTRLSTRMSFQSAKLVCSYALSWAPSTESMEHLVLGLGRHAAPYMVAAPAPEDEGEVLIIEVDGKCTPTATEAELDKRRGPRCKCPKGCSCGCQRHRGKQHRKQRGPKKRRKKGDKSKNGREVSLVVMYTLKKGPDGQLHGPINKQVWGTYAGRQAAAQWARAQATKRGFPAGTTKTVQILMDGASSLKQQLAKLFPDAIFSLDVRHAEEKLWEAGRLFYAEGSEELANYVEDLRELLYQGKAAEVVAHLRERWKKTPTRGPGNKKRRLTLNRIINYFDARLEMMQYGTWREQDLVLATGQVEGAARYVVGLRMDSGGMRWIPERAEALLHLRCIELNDDWDTFILWAYEKYKTQLEHRLPTQIRSNDPLTLATAS